jgi:3D-(3,5/4)-trihydroxycyclohexane-1,2-dione acylhydrolase (decyclizing)
VKLVVVLIDNGGYGSIGSLSQSLGSAGFGTQLRYRGEDGLPSTRAFLWTMPPTRGALASGSSRPILKDLRNALADAKASSEDDHRDAH